MPSKLSNRIISFMPNLAFFLLVHSYFLLHQIYSQHFRLFQEILDFIYSCVQKKKKQQQQQQQQQQNKTKQNKKNKTKQNKTKQNKKNLRKYSRLFCYNG